MNIRENKEMLTRYAMSLISESHNFTNEIDHLMAELKKLKDAGRKDEVENKLREIETTNPALYNALKQTVLHIAYNK